MTLGLVIGKFYPPHRGHKLLIDTARAQVDRLIVILPHHPTQTIPGELRRAWLSEIHPNCEIHLVPDELPEDAQLWANWTLHHLGQAPDIIFSSEEYGPRYAAFMGSQHIMVDQQRQQVPCSGSMIRANPLNYLDYLEPCVRAYYVRRVVLVGSESTGKTTLAQKLAEAYQTLWVPEYGREHWEKKVAGLSMDGPLPGWSPDEFLEIATQQQKRENAAARKANQVLFCDTNAFATGLWFERYMNTREPRVDAIGAQDIAHLYLLTELDVPFVQDGVRDGEKIRGWMHQRFIEELNKTQTPVVRLRGTVAQRMKIAQEAINHCMEQLRTKG